MKVKEESEKVGLKFNIQIHKSILSQRVGHSWATELNWTFFMILVRVWYMWLAAQSWLTLCYILECSLPGSSVHEILQARILKWVVISFSRRSPQPREQTHVSCVSCIAGRFFTSVVPFYSCSQSLPASESFPVSQLFAWGGQSTGILASASFLSKNSQDWSPLEWTGWISLQSKGLR